MNWFQRHLNWTVAIALILWSVVVFFAGFLFITDQTILLIYLIGLAVIVFPIAGWALKQKGKSLVYLIVLIVPITWVAYFTLPNERRSIPEKQKSLPLDIKEPRKQNPSFAVVMTLLVISLLVGAYFWNQSNITRAQLISAEEQLNSTTEQLNSTIDNLVITRKSLNDAETLVDMTEATLIDTETEFDATKEELATNKTLLNTANKKNSSMLNQYDDLREEINVRLGMTQSDMKSYVTPLNSSVSNIVQEITGGFSDDASEYWRDFERLYRWVVNNIVYSYDSYIPILPDTLSGQIRWFPEYWRMPEETLNDGTGDCEDMATLLASMIMSYTESRYETWVLVITSTDPSTPGHVGTAFPVADGRLTIIDPTGNYYTGYRNRTLGSETAAVAVARWLSYWENNDMPGAKIIAAFSDDFYRDFSDTEAFLTWVEQR
ncbi:transglutaminase-like domain-containing protein [Chloroflexota bacterium]